MKHNISSAMRECLSDWLKWTETEQERRDDHIFRSNWGLCSNVMAWQHHNWRSGTDLHAELCIMLDTEFGDEGPQRTYPFDGGDYLRYMGGDTHENEQRLAWVREQLS